MSWDVRACIPCQNNTTATIGGANAYDDVRILASRPAPPDNFRFAGTRRSHCFTEKYFIQVVHRIVCAKSSIPSSIRIARSCGRFAGLPSTLGVDKRL